MSLLATLGETKRKHHTLNYTSGFSLEKKKEAEAAVKPLLKESRAKAERTQEPNKTSQVKFWPVGVDGGAFLDFTMLFLIVCSR